ncbi:MAG: hypothetical protein INH37_14840 [Myxococcaceae bacterium]|nr:hypothetical protein [Myxococcaceae bacterium]
MKTILIDGDIVAYQAAAACEQATDWGDGLWTLHADEALAKSTLDGKIDKLMDQLGADKAIIALTDGVNWRKKVLPTYKANRADTRKPMVLPVLRQYLIDTRDAYLRPTLEGDDILGILATHPKLVPGKKVIVSLDKDMKTIPGTHFNFAKPELDEFEVTPDEARYWHMMQTLTGDTTDGYSGCPGIGPKKAEAILKAAIEAGQANYWPAVVKAFEKAGLTEHEALVQARVARICLHTDYDFKTKKVKLWNPN